MLDSSAHNPVKITVNLERKQGTGDLLLIAPRHQLLNEVAVFNHRR